jgi:diguanylate cyclase (GGDEF)-like protein
MAAVFDNVHVLGLLVQAVGAALIGLLCLMLNQVVQRSALSAWWRAWLTLACALIALLVEQGLPTTAAVSLPLYLFGEYLFGYWIIEGCAHFGGRRWPRRLLSTLIAPLAIISIALPRLIGYEFRSVFVVQSIALVSIFATALIVLSSAVRRAPSSPGLLAMRVALTLLIVIFVSYVWIFGANLLVSEPLPLTLLKLTSAAHLVLEFLLGFGGTVLVLEQSHHSIAVRNDSLTADNAKFRVEAERDALTNAYNRHAFFHMLDRLSHAKVPAQGCAAMIDVDGLKQLNDSHGHMVGDAALVRVAHAIQRVVRHDDRLFRWGGDEFLLVMLDLRATEVIARLDALNPALMIPGAVSVQVSYGVVEFAKVGELLDAMNLADVDMYARRRERVPLERRRGLGLDGMAASLPLGGSGEEPASQS